MSTSHPFAPFSAAVLVLAAMSSWTVASRAMEASVAAKPEVEAGRPVAGGLSTAARPEENDAARAKRRRAEWRRLYLLARAEDARTDIPREDYSPAMFYAGLAVLAVGAAAGTAMLALATNPPSEGFSGLQETVGFAAGAGGSFLVGLAVGIPLVAVGAHDVPIVDPEAAPKQADRDLSRLRVQVGLGCVVAGGAF